MTAPSPGLLLGLVSAGIWLVLLLGRGGFWLFRDRDDHDPAPEPATWPRVVAVVPARNEADVIARSIGSLRAQDYPGPFSVVLIDDGSTDGTAAAALAAGIRPGAAPLEVRPGAPLPPGWTGKLWALEQGVRHATAREAPDYLLLTDADIGHDPANLRALVARAEAGRLSLVTLMARLSCANLAERFLIPAFVFFFGMIFPFPWVNDARRRTAAGAGGCMLVRRTALEAAGGIASVRTALIDDCALGRRLKAQGPIRLTLTERAHSLRPYGSVAEIGRMVSRSAYAQLGYSPLLLALTLAGMALTYLVPPALALFGSGHARAAGLAAWTMMALAFLPMLRFYRASPLWGAALPAIGAAYTWFTVQSALQVWRGRGGMWKGRAQAVLSEGAGGA